MTEANRDCGRLSLLFQLLVGWGCWWNAVFCAERELATHLVPKFRANGVRFRIASTHSGGSDATSLRNSDSENAVSIVNLMLPRELRANANCAAALSSGKSATKTPSYAPMVRYQCLNFPPNCLAAFFPLLIRAGASRMPRMP
jgi:hypothetical protein